MLSVSLLLLTGCGADAEEPPPTSNATNAPQFLGVARGEAVGVDSVQLSWQPGYDEETAEEDLVYLAYAGLEDKPVSLSRPVGTSVPGAGTMTITQLPPGDYRFVVRVRDEEGLEDANTASVRVSVGDKTAPTFAGVTGAIPLNSREVLVEWKPGHDEVSPALALRYEIYAGAERETLFETKPELSLPGATSTVVDIDRGLETVWLGVRCIDESGNRESNERVTSSDLPETTAPEFFGLSSATPLGGAMELSWAPAFDNATATSEIVYRIYASEKSGAQNLLAPWAITPPGVTRFSLSDLKPSTKYYFIVQAQDLAGNRDTNSKQIVATSNPADETAPDFAGIEELNAETPTSVTVNWLAASDERTEAGSIVYEIYVAETSPADQAEKPSAVSLPGRTSAVIFGLKPETEYFALVRARDLAKNVDSNEEERSATTPAKSDDKSPPSLAGQVAAKSVPSHPDRLQVSFSGAADNEESLEGIRALVCAAPLASGCIGDAFFENLNATSLFGASGLFVSNLTPRSGYWVSVRLEDRNGNQMSSGPGKAAVTATSFSDNVVPLLESRCNQCHDYSYGTLVNVKSTFEELFLVDATSATKSYLMRTLRPSGNTDLPFSVEVPADYEGERMPSDNSPPLNSEQESVFIDWITQGAFSN